MSYPMESNAWWTGLPPPSSRPSAALTTLASLRARCKGAQRETGLNWRIIGRNRNPFPPRDAPVTDLEYKDTLASASCKMTYSCRSRIRSLPVPVSRLRYCTLVDLTVDRNLQKRTSITIPHPNKRRLIYSTSLARSPLPRHRRLLQL